MKDFEDRKALDGGKNGLEVVMKVVEKSLEVVRPGGYVILEVDTSHA